MTNAAKAAVWDAVWLPWGAAHSITGTASLNARFPGQWFQSESGLHYNWHRLACLHASGMTRSVTRSLHAARPTRVCGWSECLWVCGCKAAEQRGFGWAAVANVNSCVRCGHSYLRARMRRRCSRNSELGRRNYVHLSQARLEAGLPRAVSEGQEILCAI
jgi:hypothetical protein